MVGLGSVARSGLGVRGAAEFVGGGAAEFEVGAGYEADGAGEFATGFVAAGLFDEVFGGEGGHAEALPIGLAQMARGSPTFFSEMMSIWRKVRASI